MGDNAVTLLGVLRQQRILRPHGQATLRHKGRGKFSGKGGVVAPCHGLPGGDLIVGQRLQLGQQNRRLQIVQTGVHAHPDVIVLPAGALAVDAEGADEIVERIVIREHCAAVTVAAKGLGREEGGGGDASKGTGLFPVIFRTEALGRVLDEGKAVLLANGGNGVVVAGVAENIHRYHRLGGILPLRQHCLDLTLKACGVKVVGIGGDIAENAHRAEHGGGFGG